MATGSAFVTIITSTYSTIWPRHWEKAEHRVVQPVMSPRDCCDEHPSIALPPPPYRAQVTTFGADCRLTFLSEPWLVADFLGVQIRIIDRKQKVPYDGAKWDLLWSDPEGVVDGWALSPQYAEKGLISSHVTTLIKMYTARKKIRKNKGVKPSKFEVSVAQALFHVKKGNQELKDDLKDMYINTAIGAGCRARRRATPQPTRHGEVGMRRRDSMMMKLLVTRPIPVAVEITGASTRVIEVLNPEDDYIWIHDYHLLALPSFLRRRFNRLRIGFFLHSPFPSSELYRSLPVRDEILKSLLNCDLIGFHTFDYARHFLSCCSRMLGIEYQSKRGYIGLDYFGRTVGIKIMPVGINMMQLKSQLQLPDLESRVAELRKQFNGKTVLLGVDDLDIFKGINLKILAFEHMLKTHPKWQGRAVLVQIANPRGGSGKDVQGLKAEIEESCTRINEQFGRSGYSPVELVNRTLSSVERMAYYTVAECVVVTAVRDGMNLTPYEYIVCRQGIPGLDGGDAPKRKSMLVVSEFIGCSPSLSGAIRVNPWNIDTTAEAMNESIALSENEKQLRHEKHYRYVSTHDVAYWSKSYIHDLERSCRDHFRRRCWGIGLGFGFRVVALDRNFKKLTVDSIVADYKKSNSRVILLDYDGTLVPQTTINRTPNETVVNIMNALCADKKNVVFIVSGRGRSSLEKWFNSCPELGIAAEHGYFMSRKKQYMFVDQFKSSQNERLYPSSSHVSHESCIEAVTPHLPWMDFVRETVGENPTVNGSTEYLPLHEHSCVNLIGLNLDRETFFRRTRDEQWQINNQCSEFGWMQMAEPVMNLYTEATDGSYIETKESALVWHHQDADPGFGSAQAKEMLDHLESVLANEPVSVKSGQHIVEVKPQSVSKGFVAEKILSMLTENKRQADFVLCIGDDRSDEDMFEGIADIMRRSIVDPQTSLYACTVGQKPSKAKYYLDDTNDVLNMLEALADVSEEVGSPEESEILSPSEEA
ncbi:putative alpha,alpha-trehalose-phosphate synthase [UDP-forming] 7 [Triticum urartu]|uniref:Putative alpha,alpha-trehalose-phosphate synthase [UDP-forming] 7 n=1 Tax=Triticum urartu TaxID=4572 RepID=M8A4X7_TRIUA|nr:putative alpha,alpha-trehalose-phosphate synthase [UDP-forming] 7 [Triticum urartu]